MRTLTEQMVAYGAYHRDLRNKLTHFVGVPLVTFSIFLFMGWFRFYPTPDVPLTVATIFYLVVAVYYLRLDWQIALLQAPITLALLWLADRIALWPFADSALVFGLTFIGGWIIQLVGHGIEGRRPALADNFLQLFNAPLFLTTEVLFLLGFRNDMRHAVESQVLSQSPNTETYVTNDKVGTSEHHPHLSAR